MQGHGQFIFYKMCFYTLSTISFFTFLVKESIHPEWNLLFQAFLDAGKGVEHVCVLAFGLLQTDAEPHVLVHDEGAAAVALLHLMTAPESVLEEGPWWR